LALLYQITQSAVHCINPHCQRPFPQPWGNKFCNSCGSLLHLLDRYFPLRPLGSGGFAQIYTVWDQQTQTEKVLKVLVEDAPKALELFIQEASVLSSLHDPGIPRVEAGGFFQINLVNPKPRQLACLVMEKIHGPTLEEISQAHPQGCPEDLVMDWFVQAIRILRELHKRQIIHRDIKPSNLMLRQPSINTLQQTQQLVLIDFGGVKQFEGKILNYQPTSTRLFSSGYSPPEQISGTNVGPAADFYALGRTIIELLTGRNPLHLEDPVTGELSWRNQCRVNPQLADLLDEMIQADVKSRPADANIIRKRLVKLKANALQPGFLLPSIPNPWQIFAKIGEFILSSISFIWTIIYKSFIACVVILWTSLLSYICVAIATPLGFYVAYHSKLGNSIAEFTLQQLSRYIPALNINTGFEIVVFAFAGLGTAWGITLSGSFGQQRKFQMAALMGIIGYSLGWIILQFAKQSHPAGTGLVLWATVSVPLLTLGLGLRSHHLVYAFIAALGNATIVASLIKLSWLSPVLSFSNILNSISFFGLIGILSCLGLSVSYYFVVPCLRWLGW